MRIIGIILVIWLIIGLFAGLQRHYYNGAVSCAKAGTVAATIAAGPLELRRGQSQGQLQGSPAKQVMHPRRRGTHHVPRRLQGAGTAWTHHVPRRWQRAWKE